MSCLTCLASDRKITSLGRYRRMFEQIIADTGYNTFDLQNKEIYLCWECKATVRNSYEFAQKVHMAQMTAMLQLSDNPHLISLSKLGITKINNVDISSLGDQFIYEMPIKMESRYPAVDLCLTDPHISIETPETSTHESNENVYSQSSKDLDMKISKHKARIIKRMKSLPKSDATENNKNVYLDTSGTESIDSNDLSLDGDTSKPDKLTLKVISKDNHGRVNDLKYCRVMQTKRAKRAVINVVHGDKIDADESVKRSNSSRKNITRNLRAKGILKRNNGKRSFDSKRNFYDHPILDAIDKFILNPMDDSELKRAKKEIMNSQRFSRWELKCMQCVAMFNCQKVFEKHMRQHEPKPGHVICPICEMYVPPATLYAHKSLHYNKYDCLLCDHVSYFNAKVAWSHFSEKHLEGMIQCNYCDMEFRTVYTFRTHLNETHRGNAYCDLCKKSFVRLDAYTKHMQSAHGPDLLHRCPKCEENFGTLRELKIHCRRAHPTKSTHRDGYCVECDIKFDTLGGYLYHLQTSTAHVSPEDLIFECDFCHKRFATKNVLKCHIRGIHSGLFQCHLCDKRYRSKSGVKKHVQVSHEGVRQEKSIICELCGKGFVDKTRLGEHMAKHTGLRPHKCPFCQKDFGFKAALFTHKRLVHKIPRLKDIKHNSPELMADVVQ